MPDEVSAEGSKKTDKGDGTMASYKCLVCGYIYDPVEGDSAGGIAVGTAFEDLPDSWVCPVCGAPKSEFEKIELGPRTDSISSAHALD